MCEGVTEYLLAEMRCPDRCILDKSRPVGNEIGQRKWLEESGPKLQDTCHKSYHCSAIPFLLS